MSRAPEVHGPHRPDRVPVPLWRAALNGIGWVVAIAAVVGLGGLVLAWLATIVL